MVLTVYKLDASPPVRSVLMAIEALSLPNVVYVDVDLLAEQQMTEEYIKLNPQHTIPMLTDDDYVIWDSHAIITYLMNKYARDNPLYPSDPQKRGLVDMRLHFNSSILFHALHDADHPIFFEGETSIRPENLAKIKATYDTTEKFLTKTPWIAGEHLTIADFSCISSISTMNELLPIDPKTYPKITSWLQSCSQQEFYKKGNVPGLLGFRRYLKEYLGRAPSKH